MSTTRIIVSQPGQRLRTVEIQDRTISIGRRPDNTICLEGDNRVSKYHAIIENRNGEFWITDLGSSNGTTVNNERVKDQQKLNDGDLVCLGGATTLELQMAEPVASGAGASTTSPSWIANADITSRPSVPSINAPNIGTAGINVPQASIPTLSTPALPQVTTPTFLGMRPSLAIPLAIVFVAAGTFATMYATGLIGKSEKKVERQAATEETKVTKVTKEDDATSPASDQTESLPPTAPQSDISTTQATDVAAPAGNSDSSVEATAGLARTLAVQISQKSFYNFDPAFVSLINRYISEYRNSPGYYERANKYRDAVDREFINAQGIQPPLIGYVLAMSQTKFVEKPGTGVWNLPPPVVRDYAVGAAPPNMTDPEASTKVAAAYVRSLLDLFERDNFMYAVACYGMTMDQAGKVRTELEKRDPGGQGRFDFWKMKNAGVVQGDQVERVARFFAAGIVCENPRQFGLTEKQLSSLY
jgi:pSer/pThr/pTyr-binding forkhead associated (FHA) protein